MKIYKNIILAAVALASMGTAHSTRSNITIARVGTWSGTNTFFFQEDVSPGNIRTYRIVLSTDGARAVMSIVMAAFSLSKRISADSNNDTCTNCSIDLTNVVTVP